MGFWVFVNGYTVPPNGNFNKNIIDFLEFAEHVFCAHCARINLPFVASVEKTCFSFGGPLKQTQVLSNKTGILTSKNRFKFHQQNWGFHKQTWGNQPANIYSTNKNATRDCEKSGLNRHMSRIEAANRGTEWEDQPRNKGIFNWWNPTWPNSTIFIYWYNDIY